MVKKEEVLCADRDSLTGLADLGEEFIAIVKKEVALAKELGLDVTDVTKILKDATVLMKASRKRVQV